MTVRDLDSEKGIGGGGAVAKHAARMRPWEMAGLFAVLVAAATLFAAIVLDGWGVAEFSLDDPGPGAQAALEQQEQALRQRADLIRIHEAELLREIRNR